MKRKLMTAVMMLCVAILSGCTSLYTKTVVWETIPPDEYPLLTAVGYAPIDAQRGNTQSTKALMAMKASKLEAYRELAEQVYGQKIDGDQSLSQLVVQNSQLRASVQGLIRGARVVKAYPVGEDTYATELELDMKRVYDLYITMTKPKQIKQVKYY